MKIMFLIVPMLFLAQQVFADYKPVTPDLVDASDSGVSSSDNITNDPTPTFDVECSNGYYVHVRFDGMTNADHFCDGDGMTSVTPSNDIGDGQYEVNYGWYDGSDNSVSATSNAITVTIDTTAPTVGSISIIPGALDGTTLVISSLSRITASATDGGSGINTASCRYNIDNGMSSMTTVLGAYDGVAGKCIFTGINTSGATGISVAADDIAGNYFDASGNRITNIVLDDDTDGDAVFDTLDNCPLVANADQTDADGDGVGNACDNSPNVPNSGQEDADGDGVGDVSDNCVNDANADQVDTDSNGIGNVCEVVAEICGNSLDDDGDGQTDEECDGDGSLPNKNDVFWDVMSEIVRPDDATCTAKTNVIYAANGIPTGGNRALVTCEAIAQMMQMENAMDAEGVDSNLFDFTDWHHMTGLYFSTPHGRIEFTNEIDFMSYDFMMFLQTIMDRLDMNIGEIRLDADIVNGLRNAGAVITMYNVPDFEDVVILVDGAEDTDGVVSGIVYDRATHTIRFNAAHFTTFKASEKSNANDDDKSVWNKRAKIHSVTAQKILTFGGKERIMLTIKGDDFDKDSDVKLGSRKAYKVKYKSKKKLVAYFRPNDLKNVSDPAYVKVRNDGTLSRKFKKKIYWRELPLIKEADVK